MPSTEQNRFDRRYLPMADAIARLDLAQTDREAVARAVADAITGIIEEASTTARVHYEGWFPDAFWLLASDPLVPCAGPRDSDEGCPHGRVIRIRMHNSDEPLGRAFSWEERAPYGKVRCVSCGLPIPKRAAA